MRFDANKHHRRSIRLKGYDYTQAGAYFVTICTQNGECLFGGIDRGKMHLNDAGRMLQEVWNELPEHYPGVDVDAFVVMPNHIHGIINLVGAGTGACPHGVVFAGCCPPFQIADHGSLSAWRSPKRLATVSRQIVATQLLRTHRP